MIGSVKFDDVFKKEVGDNTFNGFVIYSGQAWYSLKDIGESYLDSAIKLTEKFADAQSKGEEHHEDNLAHPCLYLIRHSLESYLKYYLVCLVNYNQRHQFFQMKADWEKIFLSEHRLKVIGDFIWKIVSPPSIFQNKKFRGYLSFFDKFDQIDNNSTAFRYSTDAKGNAQKIHDDQWYVDVLLFLELVKSFRTEVLNFTDSWIYLYEDYGYFNNPTLAYIEKTLSQFDKFQRLLQDNHSPNEGTFVSSSGVQSLADAMIANADRFAAYLKWKKEFYEIVCGEFTEDGLIEACEGMYFGSNGYITRPLTAKEAFDKLLEKRHSFKEFRCNSNMHLSKIYEFKSIKERAQIFEVIGLQPKVVVKSKCSFFRKLGLVKVIKALRKFTR
jgi:hypothetical protein